jgi:hypothetical protein
MDTLNCPHCQTQVAGPFGILIECPGCRAVFSPSDAGGETSRPAKAQRRSGSFACPFCGSDDYPGQKRSISVVGWVLFGLWLLASVAFAIPFCFPLFLAPLAVLWLLIPTWRTVCSSCGNRIHFS